MMSIDPNLAQPPQESGPALNIQRVYIKDVSYEAPHAPEIFQAAHPPKLDLQIHIKQNTVAKDLYEVELQVTVKATTSSEPSEKEKLLFCVEVKQAGIFELRNFEAEHIQTATRIVCPSILYPYAAALISDLVSRGTFMPLHLAPVNFEAMYAQYQAAQSQSEQETAKL